MQEIIKVKDHLEQLEQTYGKDEFTEGEILEYIDSLDLMDNGDVLEVIPCNRKEFVKGILATVRY